MGDEASLAFEPHGINFRCLRVAGHEQKFHMHVSIMQIIMVKNIYKNCANLHLSTTTLEFKEIKLKGKKIVWNYNPWHELQTKSLVACESWVGKNLICSKFPVSLIGMPYSKTSLYSKTWFWYYFTVSDYDIINFKWPFARFVTAVTENDLLEISQVL